MPYPSKTDRLTITDAALALVEREGEGALTLRRLAGEIGVTANALYRYFDSRDMLVAAAADAVAHRLYLIIEDGMAEPSCGNLAEGRVRRLLTIYSSFAEDNPALYRTFLSAKREVGALLPEPHYHERLWDQSLSIIEPLVGARDAPAATVSLWSLLHGLWALRQAGVLGGAKPAEIHNYAFDALTKGLILLGEQGRRVSESGIDAQPFRSEDRR